MDNQTFIDTDINSETRVQIEKLEIGLCKIVNKRLFNNKITVKQLLDEIEIRLQGYIWAEKELPPKYISYPYNWKESVKEAFYNWLTYKLHGRLYNWFYKIKLEYPVQYIRHKLTGRVIYPDFRPNIPNEIHSFIIQVHTLLNYYKDEQ